MNNFQLIFTISTTFLVGIVLIKLYIKFARRHCVSRRRLDGKVAIITGANTGIGFETAQELARRGAKVILACRDLNKAEAAAGAIRSETGSREVVVRKLDLSSLTQIRSFCADILKEESRLDILINNAGVAFTKKVLTEDGLEGHMGTNHFGPFLLTNLLLGLLLKSHDNMANRIVNVASAAHTMAKELDLDNLNSEKSYDNTYIYGRTKLCNILFTTELNRRIQEKVRGHIVNVNAVHPGVVRTEFFRNINTIFWFRWLYQIFQTFLLTPWEGAQTTLHVAISEYVDQVSGFYWDNCVYKKPTQLAQDVQLAKDLWTKSVKFVKLEAHEYHLPGSYL